MAKETMKARIDIKPLSVNEVWRGRRFKTPAYKAYERAMLFMLPSMTLPEKPYEICFEFGVSTMNADVDNPTKPAMDILQLRYGFNDRDVMRLVLDKKKVEKGKEYLQFEIKNLTL